VIRTLVRFVVLEVRLFLIALQFFTRVPVPAWVGYEPAWLQWSVRYYPLVGAVVGCFGALVMACAGLWWPPTVAVVLGMAATIWMTGGFHEDGWADTCDGLGGSVSRERALEIMKDSRLGSYGTLGLVLILMLKAAVLTALLSPVVQELSSSESSNIHHVLLGWTAMGLIWAHALSRLVPVWLIRWLPYAGDLAHAKAKPLGLQASNATVLAAMAITALIAAALWLVLDHLGWPVQTWWRAMGWSTLAALGMTAWVARWLQGRLGGFTGDTLGASQQLSEVAILLAWLAVVHPQAAGLM
jgi:adenosylcobinamide-GDP ribazoletransferase